MRLETQAFQKQQMQQKELAKREQDELRKKAREGVESDAKTAVDSERNSQAEKLQRAIAQRTEQLEQIELKKRRREEEKLRKQQEAEDLLLKIQAGAAMEKEKADTKLQMRKKQALDALEQSSKSQKMREEKMQADLLKDMLEADDYRRLRELREKEKADREAEKQAERDLVAENQARRHDSDKQGDNEAQANAELERAEKDRLAIERDKMERERKAALRMETQMFNRQQIQEKEMAKKAQNDERHMARTRYEVDLMSFEADERNRKQEKKQKLADYNLELQRQVASKVPSAIAKDSMSECELLLNKALLDEAAAALANGTSAPAPSPRERLSCLA